MDRSVTNNYQELADDESKAEGPKLQLWRCRRVLCVLTLLNPDDIHTNPLTAVVWASRQVTLTSPRILTAAYEQHRGELLPSEPEDVTGNQVNRLVPDHTIQSPVSTDIGGRSINDVHFQFFDETTTTSNSH